MSSKFRLNKALLVDARMDELFSNSKLFSSADSLSEETPIPQLPQGIMVQSFTPPEIEILLIDDQAIVGEVVQRLLASDIDIQLRHCCDPRQALQVAIAKPPNVILLDLVMPEVDGLLLLRWLRRHSATREIPIVMLSATEDPELKANAFTQGANDYLIKPPAADELIARLRYHARSYQNFQGMVSATQLAKAQAQQLEKTLQVLQATQAQLIQTEKLAGLEQLVAGMAHEINNPINFIYGNLTYAQEYIEQLLQVAQLNQQPCSSACSRLLQQAAYVDIEFVAEDLPRLLNSMKVGVERVQQIILSLRNFSHLHQADLKAVNIHEGLESTLLILQHRFAGSSKMARIELIKDYGSLPLVECYPAQLNQVFMNVLSNAVDAIQEMRQKNEEFCVGQIHISTRSSDRATAIVHITDNGCGIPEEIQPRIFDPFFTTKPVGKGTGLGLSSSYQVIVNQHGGVLRCESVPNQGTQIWIEIPLKTLPNS